MRYLPLAMLLTFAAAPATPPMAVSVNVQPSVMDAYQLLTRKTPETYTCSAFVLEVGTHQMLANAQLVVLPGKTETTRSTHGDYGVEFTMKINAAGDRADAHVIVRRSDTIVSEQRSMITLLRPRAGNIPIQ
jgi:hypothetical protein